MKKTFPIIGILILLLVSSGCNGATLEVANTAIPSSTVVPTNTSTPTPANTVTPTSTPEPIFLTLGSPFVSQCPPTVLVDDLFNGVDKENAYDENHGHFDLIPDCDYKNIANEVVAPVSGYVNRVPQGGGGVSITLSPRTYLEGIENAMNFMGIKDFSLAKVSEITIVMNHFTVLPEVKNGQIIDKGTSIGDLFNSNPHNANWAYVLAYQVMIFYNGRLYKVSPTLFVPDSRVPINFTIPNEPIYDNIFPLSDDGTTRLGAWKCNWAWVNRIGGGNQHCIPEPNFYP